MAIQFNSKESKAFRESLAKFYISECSVADLVVTTTKRISDLKKHIESNNELLEKYADKEETATGKKITEITEEISTDEQEIICAKTRLSDFKKLQKDNTEPALAYVSTALLKAIKEYLTDIFDENAEKRLFLEMKTFFENAGFTVTTESEVHNFIKVFGVDYASAKKIVKSQGNLLSVKRDNQYLKILMGALCNEPHLRAQLPIVKFENIIESKLK